MSHAIEDAVLLLGGTGTRLGLLTRTGNKHLLPVYDKPLAMRAAQFLVQHGIKRIVAVAPSNDIPVFARLLEGSFGDGATISFVAQPEPSGTADAIRRGAGSLRASQYIAVFGDNVFSAEFVPDFSRLSSDMDLRCFTRWMDQGVEHLTVVGRGYRGQRELLRRPHSISRGYVLAGLFAIRFDALQEFSLNNNVMPGEEDDILAFIAACLSDTRCEVTQFAASWFDAGYSCEALWRAGLAVRHECLEQRISQTLTGE